MEVFHLDEYIGLLITHPGSFRKYAAGSNSCNELELHTTTCSTVMLGGSPSKLSSVWATSWPTAPIDIAFLGVGENSRHCVQRSTGRFLEPKSHISLSNWMKHAASSKSAKAGLRIFQARPRWQFRCRCARFPEGEKRNSCRRS